MGGAWAGVMAAGAGSSSLPVHIVNAVHRITALKTDRASPSHSRGDQYAVAVHQVNSVVTVHILAIGGGAIPCGHLHTCKRGQGGVGTGGEQDSGQANQTGGSEGWRGGRGHAGRVAKVPAPPT